VVVQYQIATSGGLWFTDSHPSIGIHHSELILTVLFISADGHWGNFWPMPMWFSAVQSGAVQAEFGILTWHEAHWRMVSRKIESRTPFKILGMPGRLSINIRTTTSKAFSFGLYGTWGCSQGYRRLYSHLCRGPHIPTNNWGLESQGYTNFVHLSCTKCQEKSGHIPHDVLMKFLGTPLSPRRFPFWRLKSIVFLRDGRHSLHVRNPGPINGFVHKKVGEVSWKNRINTNHHGEIMVYIGISIV